MDFVRLRTGWLQLKFLFQMVIKKKKTMGSNVIKLDYNLKEVMGVYFPSKMFKNSPPGGNGAVCNIVKRLINK